MKRLMVIGVVLALLFAGCAGFGKFSTGGQSAIDFVCAPTPEQQATATTMLAALDAAQAAGAIFYPALGIVKASAVLTTISAGGCFLLTELAEAFKAVDAANVSTAKARAAKSTAAVLVWQLPEYSPLRNLLKK